MSWYKKALGPGFPIDQKRRMPETERELWDYYHRDDPIRGKQDYNDEFIGKENDAISTKEVDSKFERFRKITEYEEQIKEVQQQMAMTKDPSSLKQLQSFINRTQSYIDKLYSSKTLYKPKK